MLQKDDRESLDSRLKALAGNSVSNTDQLRAQINSVFQDEIQKQKLIILSLTKGKIHLVEKLMNISHVMADILSADAENIEEFKAEFQEESLPDKIKILEGIVKAILSLTASAQFVEQLKSALEAVEREMLHERDMATNEYANFRKMFDQIRALDVANRASEDAKVIEDEQ